MLMKKKKQKKYRLKKIWLLIFPIIIISIILFNYNNLKLIYLSKTTGYNKETINTFFEENLLETIKKQEYSQTLEQIINTKYYNNKYINDYLLINYHKTPNFIKNISILLEKGYKYIDINNIYNTLNDNSINLIISYDYIEDLNNILSINYFKEDNLDRYIKYNNKTNLDIETVLTYVNIGLDNDYYTNVSNISNQEDILVLVNKYNKLKKDYEPSDLKTINSKYQWYGRSNKLRKDASIAFEEMCEDAKKDNIYIYAGSGYRSYNTQLSLYNKYVAEDGFKAAETYSARAGYSEHQTGLAMDIANKTSFISKDDKEYTWLINNSYKYGFILRYPKGKENITGYMYEEWHYRYVGKNVAKEIYEAKLTYEEYLAKK